MITINANDKEYKVPTNWDELKCKHYIDLIQLNINCDLFPVLYTQRMLEVICELQEWELDDMPIKELAELAPVLAKGFDFEELKNIPFTTNTLIINGITYAFYTPQTIDKITFSEQRYLEHLEQSQNLYDTFIKVAAVMIRPATQETTLEGRSYWKLERFNKDDIEHRAGILGENLSTRNMVMIRNFFLTGASGIQKNTKPYLSKRVKKTKQ